MSTNPVHVLRARLSGYPRDSRVFLVGPQHLTARLVEDAGSSQSGDEVVDLGAPEAVFGRPVDTAGNVLVAGISYGDRWAQWNLAGPAPAVPPRSA